MLGADVGWLIRSVRLISEGQRFGMDVHVNCFVIFGAYPELAELRAIQVFARRAGSEASGSN